MNRMMRKFIEITSPMEGKDNPINNRDHLGISYPGSES